jgi:hypothetical protein
MFRQILAPLGGSGVQAALGGLLHRWPDMSAPQHFWYAVRLASLQAFKPTRRFPPVSSWIPCRERRSPCQL